MHLRVLAINVQNTAGNPRRIGLLNSGIQRIAPDLVAFEEVIQSPERKQLEELLQETGLHGTHQADVMASPPPWADHYGGSAVATRWPHRVAEVIDPRLPDAMDVPWATMAVSVPVPGEGELLFIAASTSWRLEAESARERQAVTLADLDARHRGPLPTIIAGDFNATPDAASIRYLTGQQAKRPLPRCVGRGRPGTGLHLEHRQPERPLRDGRHRPPAPSSTQDRLRIRRILVCPPKRPLLHQLCRARF
jgi:endonuclease/exonuclease/phosphatase family metal-dependent hydrolase